MFKENSIGQENQELRSEDTAKKISPELKVEVDRLINCLSKGDVRDALEIIDKFKPSDEIIKSPEVQEAAKQGLIKCLSGGSSYIDKALEIIDRFKLSDEIIKSPEVQEAAKQVLINRLSKGYSSVDETIVIIDKLKIPDEIVQEIVKQVLINRLSEGYVDYALEIIDKFKPSDEIIKSPEVQEAAKQVLIFCLSEGDVNFVTKIIDKFKLSDEVIKSPEVQEAAKQGLINCLSEGSSYIDNAVIIIYNFEPSDEIIKSPEVQEAAKQVLIKCLSGGSSYIDKALEIIDRFKLSDEIIKSPEVQEAAKQVLINRLSEDYVRYAIRIIDKFKLSDEVIKSPEVQEAAKQLLIKYLSIGEFYKAIEMIDKLKLSDEIVQEAAKQGLINCLSDGYVDFAVKIIYKFKLSDEIIKSPEVQEVVKQWLINRLSRGYINDITKIIDGLKLPDEIIKSPEVQEAAKQVLMVSDNYYKNEDMYQFFGDKKEQLKERCEKYNLYLKEYFTCENEIEKEDFQKLNKEEQNKKIFGLLKKGCSWWKDNENVATPFKEGAEYFGYEKMFKYIKGNNRHDALYAFKNIVDIAKKTNLAPHKFYENILDQVKKDTSQYEEDNPVDSYEYLNQISQINLDESEQILENARKYETIDKLQNLVKLFDNKDNICQNWGYLKKYYELTQLLGKTELLGKLQEIKRTNPKLYNYAETLMFHPKIEMNKVIMFVEKPTKFFNLSDEHSQELHELKKPSNYTQIPYLDLSPEELRDSLVEGSLDEIQTFYPLEIDYQIAKDSNLPVKISTEEISTMESVSTQDLLKWVFQDKKKQAELNIGNGKELRNNLQELFKKHKLGLRDYIDNKILLPENLREEDVRNIIFDDKIGIKKEKKTSSSNYQFRAKLNLKSDPDAVVAGNDTACCMPFGSGKNNVYTFNPVCALFTLQEKKGDIWRTVAQSVMTKDVDIKKNIANVMNEMNNERENPHPNSLVDENILNKSKQYLTADNVEVAPNFNNRPNAGLIIENIYRDFFQEYLRRFNQQQKIDDKKFIIGEGNSDALTHLNQINNTYLPVAPVSYSDNARGTSLLLELDKNTEKNMIVNRAIREVSKPNINPELIDNNLATGISYLTHEDCLKIAYLEGKAYADNPTLMTYLHNLENGLIAKDINNAAKDRPNMSLKYENGEGKTLGYIFAYEGKDDDKNPTIYITDLAAHPEAKMVGGRLINGFIDLYKKFYLDKGNMMPITARARDNTSYRIIQRQLDNLGKKAGIKFTLEEEGSDYSGGEEMHEIKLVPNRI